MDLPGGVEDGWENEVGVGKADRAEVGGVDLIAEFKGESKEAGKGHCSGESYEVQQCDSDE